MLKCAEPAETFGFYFRQDGNILKNLSGKQYDLITFKKVTLVTKGCRRRIRGMREKVIQFSREDDGGPN